MKPPAVFPRPFLLPVLAILALLAGAAGPLSGACGPFTDVNDAGFCPFVIEVFTLNITTGTTSTTYDPSSAVSRLQMAAFLSRTVDRTLLRGSRRSAIGQFWTTKAPANLGITTVAGSPNSVVSDGIDLWVPSTFYVVHVAGGSGKVIDLWTGASNAYGSVFGMGRVFVTDVNNSVLYRIDPTQPAGALTTVAATGQFPYTVAFDGSRLWSGNFTSISIITPTVSLPWTVTTITTGFSKPNAVVYDGSNVWTADNGTNTMLKLDSNGAVLQTVTVPSPVNPIFDGTNLWVPGGGFDRVSVIRPSTGTVLATLSGNGLNDPLAAAFDGQRILVVNPSPANTVSLWKAADLTPIGTFDLGASTGPYNATSDGVYFWIALNQKGALGRF
jgi:S-layer family protein